jgi:hypothetical protein
MERKVSKLVTVTNRIKSMSLIMLQIILKDLALKESKSAIGKMV